MTTHTLKTCLEPFTAVRYGLKVHEVRRNDRDFKQDDLVVLMEFDEKAQKLTGNTIVAKIGTVTLGGSWGLPDDLCVFSIHLIGNHP